MYDRKDSG